MADDDQRGIRLITFMPMVFVLMGVLMLLAVFAVNTTAAQIALVIALLAVGIAFSAAMLRQGRTQR